MIAYFDSSLIMSILLEEDRELEAASIWSGHKIKISSVLLKIETHISLLRFYNRQKNKFDSMWLAGKKDKLKELLSDVFFTDITEAFADFVSRDDAFAGCKSLDAIHVATALKARNNPSNKNILVCSFDNNMRALAMQLGFNVNGKIN